jgi:predicted Zn-dependent protease
MRMSWRVRLRALVQALMWLAVCGVARPRPVSAVSITEEKELGRTFALEARAKLALIDDVEVNNYVNRIGQRIVGGLGDQPFKYQFFVVRDPRINAFAVPGGYVYVHGGLLTQASNDDEVAGVLAHEVAHVNAHHLARQQEATQLMNYATLLGMLLSVIQPAIGAGAVAANASVQLQYRREFEQEADYLGAGYMRQAGYDPRGMLDFFKKILDEQRTTPTFAPPYLLSHPLTDARLTNLEAVLRTHQWDRGPRPPASLDLERVQLLTRTASEPAADVVDVYRRGAEAHPASGRARYLLGLAYLESGTFDAARETLEAARQLGSVDVDRDLGRTYLRLRQPEKARELLSRATEVDPEDPLGHFELAKALETLHDSTAAMREYGRAVQLDPGLAEAHYGLGMLAGRTGRPGDGFYHLAMAFKLRGEFDKALSQFEKAAPLMTAGSEQAQDVHDEIAELKDYLRHGHSRQR